MREFAENGRVDRTYGSTSASSPPPTTPAPVAAAPPPVVARLRQLRPSSASDREGRHGNAFDSSPIRIRLTDDIPADAQEGQALRFVTTEDVHAGDVVVIAKGAAVTGAIVERPKKKFPGIAGRYVQAAAGGCGRRRKLNVRATPGKLRRSVAAIVEANGQKKSRISRLRRTEYIAYMDASRTYPSKNRTDFQ